MAHYKDKLHVKMSLLRKRVNEHAAKKAARNAQELQLFKDTQSRYTEEMDTLDREISDFEAWRHMMWSDPLPTIPDSIHCTSSQIGSFTYTDCY